MSRTLLTSAIATLAVLSFGCSDRSPTGPRAGQGMLAVKLTDAPTPLDSIKEVNIFVDRVDARRADARTEDLDHDLEHEHAEHEGGSAADSTLWVTIASPKKSFNLLTLQNGVTAFLGVTPVDTGHFKAIRLVIDASKSNIVLKDGTILTAASKPPVEFESAGMHGLLVELNETLEVGESTTTTLVVDIRLGESVSLKGRTVRDGFLFRPVVKGQREKRD